MHKPIYCMLWLLCSALMMGCGKEEVAKPDQPILPERIVLDAGDTTMAIGSVNLLATLVLPENTTDKFLRWSSSDTSVVSVHGNGQIKARKPGTAVITVKTRSGVASMSKKVVVQKDIERIVGVMEYTHESPWRELTVRALIHNSSNTPMLIKHIEEHKPPQPFMPYPFGFFDFVIAPQTSGNPAFFDQDASAEGYGYNWYTKFYFLLDKEKYVITVYNGRYEIEAWSGVIKQQP